MLCVPYKIRKEVKLLRKSVPNLLNPRGGVVMFKKWTILAVTLVMLSTLANAALVTPTHIGSYNAPISITMNLLPHYSMQAVNPARQKYLEEAYEEWIKKNPNVQVYFQIISGPTAMAKLLTQARSGTAPDVAQVDSFVLPRFYDYLQPIDKYFADDEINDLLPYCQKGMKHDGQLKALWFTTDVRVLYYRKDLISKPPKTWAELFELGKKLKKEHPNMNVFMYPAGKNEATMICLMPLFWAQGGQLVDSAGQPVFNKGKNREYMLNLLNFLKETVDTGITPRRVNTITAEAQLNQDVAAGNVAMFIGGNWQVGQMGNLLGTSALNEKWGVAPLPQIRDNVESTGVGGWTWGIFTKDPEKQAAIIRMINEIYFGSHGMFGWTKAAGYLPTRQSVYKDYAYYATNPWMQKFVDIMKYGKPRPGFSIYPTISTNLQVAISNVVSGISSPKEALDTAWKNVIQEYNRMK